MHHKVSGLKQQKYILSQLWEARNSKSRCGQGLAPRKALEKVPSLSLLSF